MRADRLAKLKLLELGVLVGQIILRLVADQRACIGNILARSR
jgi:hypothetical protein